MVQIPSITSVNISTMSIIKQFNNTFTPFIPLFMSLSKETFLWIILGIIALQIMKFPYHGCYLWRKKENKQ